MKQRKMFLAVALLIASFAVIAGKLLAPQPVQLLLEDGRAVPVVGTVFFDFDEVILLVAFAWLGGACLAYLYLVGEGERENKPTLDKNEIIKLLDGDEKKLYARIAERGEVLQKDLVLEGEFNRVKITRLLNKLEEKGLVLRIKYGMTNKIIPKKLQ